MKTRTFVLLGVAVSLALVLTAAVAAQTLPGSTLEHPLQEEVGAERPPTPLSQELREGPGPALSGAEGVKATAAITLGQPGTSFRYVQTLGVTEEPYPADAQHLNYPNGIFVDDSDNLYVAEEYGQRVLKFDAAGVNQLIVGHVGLPFHHDDYLSEPKDVAVDGNGHFWVAMSNAVKEFEADGTVVQWLPDADPWSSGSDNEHFNNPTGLAFDSAGRLYVSDHWNHRVQVYTLTVGGAPVYSATIGVTDESGSDNNHFNEPQHIATYGDSLYVADASNHRVQIYDIGDSSVTYTATIGVSGESGDDADHLNRPSGVAVNASYVYVADSNNNRVQVFDRITRAYVATIGTGWGTSNDQSENPRDVAVDSAGNIYVADWDNARVQQFDSSRVYQHTYGVTDTPYVTDTTRLNGPWGIAVTSGGSIYATEDRGARLVKLSAAGVQQWTVGQAGVGGDDNAHFNSWYPGPQGVAIDTSGRVYVADAGNYRIQIFSSNGVYSATFGSYGDGPYGFDVPTGIAISPVNGDIYVTDRNNHRVQVYNSSRVYTATLGVTGVSGADNAHFNGPQGVAVDASGNIYVADTDNHRVQKCALSGSGYTCTTFVGVTGECGTDFDHLCTPHAVAVDTAGRVYVAEDEHRVQIFDATGAYLTTLGGGFGANTGLLRNPGGVAVDSAGNVYVADTNNHRIQKFAPGVPGWKQVNINGFGDRLNAEGVESLEVFNGQLYAGASNWDSGARVWRTSDGTTWTAASEPGFGSAYTNTNTLVFDMIEFKGQLYAGTGKWWNDGIAGQVWRSSNGTVWTQVGDDGFGNANNVGVTTLGVFSDTLYAATLNTTDGLEIWRSSDGLGWTGVVTNGFNGGSNYYICTGLTVFNGYLYAAVEASSTAAAQVWRTNDGVTWTQVNMDGFGDPDNDQTGGFAIFGGYLYVGTRNDTTGAQLYRSPNGTTWEQAMGNGFGDNNNYKIDSLFAFNGYLYAGTRNEVTGVEVWRSPNGTWWSQVNPDGFGDSNNEGTIWSIGTVAFNNRLYIGTAWNKANGGEVWMMLRQVYLPLVVRQYP
jgi:DNA-binding beta-propeller fold protein YncE